MNANEPPKDHAEGGEDYESAFDDEQGRASWQRLLFMIVIAMLFSIGVMVGGIVAVLQFFFVLLTGETKEELSSVGRQLGEYAREIALYMSFNTDERPFPFDRDWPSG